MRPRGAVVAVFDMQQETMQATAAPATDSGSTPPAKPVCVRYEGNQSKRWDGKVVKIDRAWMEDNCSQDLRVGAAVEMPWRGKGGKTKVWKGVIVSDDDNKEAVLASSSKKRKSKLVYMYD